MPVIVTLLHNDAAKTRLLTDPAPRFNTVYTHPRDIKAKAGTRRMSELIGRLNRLRASLLPDKER